MQCPETPVWEQFLENRIEYGPNGDLAEHLEGCALCREQVDFCKSEDNYFGSALAELSVPDGLEEVLISRIYQVERSWQWLKTGLVGLLLSSGLVAVFVGWLPLFHIIGRLTRSLAVESILLQFLVLLVNLVRWAAEGVQRGEPLLPTFAALLVACLAGLFVQGRKGGYSNA